jgi:hypothetical protein
MPFPLIGLAVTGVAKGVGALLKKKGSKAAQSLVSNVGNAHPVNATVKKGGFLSNVFGGKKKAAKIAEAAQAAATAQEAVDKKKYEKQSSTFMWILLAVGGFFVLMFTLGKRGKR